MVLALDQERRAAPVPLAVEPSTEEEFHCPACRDLCINFSQPRKSAYLFIHGTDDEKFGVFLRG